MTNQLLSVIKRKIAGPLLGCTVEEVNVTNSSPRYQESNIDSTIDSVKPDVSNLSVDQITLKWEEDQTALKQQKERIQILMEDNHRLLSIISTLKMELKEVLLDFEILTKSVKMLSSGKKILDNILVRP